MDIFTEAYFTAALWTEDPHPQSGEFQQHDDWTLASIDPAWMAEQIAQCEHFRNAYASLIDGRESDAGHDFWLTRNGHGAGFWDGDWPEPAATVLTDACKAYGETDLQMTFDYDR